MKVVVAKNRIEEYELRARYLKEDHLLAGRGRRETEFKIKRLLRFLLLAPHDRVLDIGPGNGLLFELIHGQVSECYGVDPSEAMVDRLRKKFASIPKVRFEVAFASKLPFPDGMFDKVVISDVISYMESEEEVRKSIAEVKRVTKIGAQVYIGDVPFVDEHRLPQRRKTMAEWVRRKMREGGVGELASSARLQIARTIRRMLNLEPVLVPSTHGLCFGDEYFLALCREHHLDGTAMRTETIHGISATRNDYVLNRVPECS
jgi:ubiquinone/menaquinone biosynthesis C-methylase UbiE